MLESPRIERRSHLYGLARIRKQELLRSLKRLTLRGEVKPTREAGGRISYQMTPPPGRWARVSVAVLQDRWLNKTDVG